VVPHTLDFDCRAVRDVVDVETDRIVERTARNALAEESGRLPGSYVFELKSQVVAGLAH
jgi:hypothetical protein